MKQWKDGDKFTAIDYTSERDSIKNTILEKDEETIFKNRKLFILSETRPEDVYTDTVWMDPRENRYSNYRLNLDFNILLVTALLQQESSVDTNFDFDIDFYGFRSRKFETDYTTLSLENNTVGNISLNASGLSVPSLIDLDNVIQGIKSENSIEASVPSLLNIGNTITGNISLNAEAPSVPTFLDLNYNLDYEKVLNASEATFTTFLDVEHTIDGQVFLNEITTARTTFLNFNNNIIAYITLDTEGPSVPTFLNLNNAISGSISLSETKPSTLTQINLNNAISGAISLSESKAANLTSLDFNHQIVSGVFLQETKSSEETVLNFNHNISGFSTVQTFLTQAKSFNVSTTVELDFTDTNVSTVYLPSGATITLRNQVPAGTGITITAPLTVNDGSNTWDFQKWRFNSTGVEQTQRVISSVVNNDELYELYYELPTPPAAWTLYTIGEPYDETFNVFSDNDTSPSAILALVNAQFPPENYDIGDWKRVRVFNYDMELIATRYVQRTS